MLNKHIENVFNKLRRISKNELLLIMNEYLRRYDVSDIKTILRAKYANLGEEKVSSLLTAAGALSREQLATFLEQENIQGVLQQATLAGVEVTDTEKLADIEDNMERGYYEHMFSLTEKIPKNQFIKQFLQQEVEVKNIINILRLKQVGAVETQSIALPVSEKFEKRINKLIQREIMEAEKAMKGTPYQELLQKGLEHYPETNSLSELEIVLQQWLLQQTKQLAKGRLASVEYVLGYLFAKEIEARNLRIIVRGKQVDASPEFIESQLVIRHG